MSDLQSELESLRRENARLRKLLKLTDAEAAPARGTQTAWFDKAPGSVDARSSSKAKLAFFGALFGARRDVYAVRWENTRTGDAGWMPAVAGGWRKGMDRRGAALPAADGGGVAAHLVGDVFIGLYPLLPGDTCSSWPTSTARRRCSTPWPTSRRRAPAVCRRRWRSPNPARRPCVDLLHRRAGGGRAASAPRSCTRRWCVAAMDLRSYDRLFPNQDVLPGGGFGNLIAAPLQGRRRKDGTTVFLDLGHARTVRRPVGVPVDAGPANPESIARQALPPPAPMSAPMSRSDATRANPAAPPVVHGKPAPG